MLADLDSLERRLIQAQKRARGGDKESIAAAAVMEPLVTALQAGKPARTAIPPGEEEAVRRLQLLTSKPVLYVCNVEEASAASGNAFSERVREWAASQHAPTIVVSAAIEAEVSQLPDADRKEFLETLGLTQSGLDQVIRAGYDLLQLLTYFTCGPKETRAWTITQGTRAPQAAAVIHKDFERGFIACETIAYPDFVACRGVTGCQRGGQDAGRGQDLRCQGWRRATVPLQRLDDPIGGMAPFLLPTILLLPVLLVSALNQQMRCA